MNNCKKCCEINTVSLTNVSHQVHTVVWYRQITDFFQYIHAWIKEGFIIINYDLSLLQFLFCKNTVFALLFCYISNGWLQLELELTQYLWKKGWLQVLVSKKHSKLENTRSLGKTSWNNDGTTQIYGCKCSFEITISLKWKYLSNTLYIDNS